MNGRRKLRALAAAGSLGGFALLVAAGSAGARAGAEPLLC
jgi:hypothetical protein